MMVGGGGRYRLLKFARFAAVTCIYVSAVTVIGNGLHIGTIFNPTTVKHSQFNATNDDNDDKDHQNSSGGGGSGSTFTRTSSWSNLTTSNTPQQNYFRYVNIGYLLNECQQFVNATVAKQEEQLRLQKMQQYRDDTTRSWFWRLLLWPSSWLWKKTESEPSSQSNTHITYTIDHSTVLVREGFCGIPIPTKSLRSTFSQVVFSGILRSCDQSNNSNDKSNKQQVHGEYDGRRICALATSVNNKPFQIDHIFFLDETTGGDTTKDFLFHERNQALDQLNTYYRSRDIIQTVFKDGHRISAKVIKDDQFTSEEDFDADRLLQLTKPYFEYYRKPAPWQTIWNKLKQN